MNLIYKNKEEIECLRQAGRISAELLDWITDYVQPNVTTGYLNDLLHDRMTTEYKVIPAPLNYRGFPKATCISTNHQVCHGIPGERILKNGDIVNIDITVIKDGWHGDCSRMFEVGEVSIAARRLNKVAKDCLYAGIEKVRPGVTLGDLGRTIQRLGESNSYSIVREYCGHGIGRHFHEEPQILHYGSPGVGLVLEEGLTFTIEPMLNQGRAETKLLKDGWTVVTRDRSLSAQWEHTIAITNDGCEILTLS